MQIRNAMRTFLSYSCSCNCNCHGATEAPSLSPNLLILFNDPDDTEPMQYIFDETLRIASRGNNVHWIRGKPAMHTPKIPKGTTALRPNDLARIHLHYGFDALPSLHSFSWHFTNIECANLLAQLGMAANWIGSRHSQDYQQQHFPVVVVLRELPEHYRIASMYSSHILRWRNDKIWTNLLESDGRKLAEDVQS
uniref:LysR_substrate domain-containing protein n=1 Tax=Globodera pallida TaxID=36090 RepID=A0A183CMJ3_GLOPA